MELLQFAGIMAAFAVAALLWVLIVFIPGRTMERCEGRQPSSRDEEDPAGSGPPP